MADSTEMYLKRLQILQKIRDLAGGQLDLPQICTIGDQSAGKSSLMSDCTGVKFPEKAGICTKAPIVVECKYNEKLSEDIYEIQTIAGGVYEKCSGADDLRQRIDSAQTAALSEHHADEGAGKISMREIRARVSGPAQMNVILVDLPGIIHNGEGVAETRELIERYCKPEQTLILLTSEAKQDKEGIAAMTLAGTYDPEGNRTLRVLTKFDVFGSDEEKQRARDLVKEEEPRALGCHAVVCRPNGGDGGGTGQELDGLPPQRAGVAALKKRLPALYAALIARTLPALREQVLKRLQEAQDGLDFLGPLPPEKMEMVKGLQGAVPDREGVEESLTPALQAFREAVLATEERLTREWTDAKFRPNAFSLPPFQGGRAAMQCMREIAEQWWREPAEAYYKEVCKVVEGSMQPSAQGKKQISKRLLETVRSQWLQFCRDILFQHFRESLQATRLQERSYGTINQVFHAHYDQLVLPDELCTRLSREVQAKVVEVTKNCSRVGGGAGLEEQVAVCMKDWLRKQALVWLADNEQADLDQQQQQRIFASVKALFAVESRTFVDNVVKVTRDEVVERRERWFQSSMVTEEVLASAVEDAETLQLRDKHMKLKAAMQTSLLELQKIT